MALKKASARTLAALLEHCKGIPQQQCVSLTEAAPLTHQAHVPDQTLTCYSRQVSAAEMT